MEGGPRSWGQVLKAGAWCTEVASALEKAAGCPQGDVQVSYMVFEWEVVRELPWKPKEREERYGLVEEHSSAGREDLVNFLKLNWDRHRSMNK